MTITHITPREQQLLTEAEALRGQIQFWRNQAITLAEKLTHLERQLDQTRQIVSDMDRRILRGGK